MASFIFLDGGKISLGWTAEVQVIGIGGRVEIGNAGQRDFYVAQEAQVLYPFDKIRTQKKSYIELAFDDKKENVTRIEENTYTVLLIKEDEKIELLQGRIFVMLQDLPVGAAFEIRTPTAVTGARGTEWLTEVDEKGTTVESYSGKPYIQSFDKTGKRIGKMFFVTAGHMGCARNFMAPAALIKIPAAKIRQWNKLKPLIQERAIKAIKMPKVYQNIPASIQKKIPQPRKYKTDKISQFMPDFDFKPTDRIQSSESTSLKKKSPDSTQYNLKQKGQRIQSTNIQLKDDN